MSHDFRSAPLSSRSRDVGGAAAALQNAELLLRVAAFHMCSSVPPIRAEARLGTIQDDGDALLIDPHWFQGLLGGPSIQRFENVARPLGAISFALARFHARTHAPAMTGRVLARAGLPPVLLPESVSGARALHVGGTGMGSSAQAIGANYYLERVRLGHAGLLAS